MKKKIVITLVIPIAFAFCVVPAWAQTQEQKHFAQVVYDARLAEGDNNTTAANAIKKAVLNAKSYDDPAQVAYEARIKENKNSNQPFDQSKKNNPADKIHQAVKNEEKKLADSGLVIARMFGSREANDAINTLATVFYTFSPDSPNKSALKKIELFNDVYQMAKICQKLKNGTNEYERANLTLDLVGKVGAYGFGDVRKKMLSCVIDGSKNIIAAHKYKMDDIDLLWSGLDWYMTGGGASEYRELVLVLHKAGKSAEMINKTVNALELLRKMN